MKYEEDPSYTWESKNYYSLLVVSNISTQVYTLFSLKDFVTCVEFRVAQLYLRKKRL